MNIMSYISTIYAQIPASQLKEHETTSRPQTLAHTAIHQFVVHANPLIARIMVHRKNNKSGFHPPQRHVLAGSQHQRREMRRKLLLSENVGKSRGPLHVPTDFGLT